MRSISTASIVNGAVDDLLASRHHQQQIDLRYRHRPESVRTIVADELATLQQRRNAATTNPQEESNA